MSSDGQHEEFVIPRELFGDTYSTDELLTTLFVENMLLREQVAHLREELESGDRDSPDREPSEGNPGERTPPVAEPTARQPPLRLVEPSEIHSGIRFIHSREYVREQQAPRTKVRHLVIANDYPRLGAEYGNGFVHRRVKSYIAAGAHVDVVAFNQRRSPGIYEHDGVLVLEGHEDELSGLLAQVEYDSISVHFLNRDMWNTFQPYAKSTGTPFSVFVHGFEADRWIRRVFDARSPKDLKHRVLRTFHLQDFWRMVTTSDYTAENFVFVSKYWQRAVEQDMGVMFPRDRVKIIHNVVDTHLFSYEPKRPEQRFKFLWIRSAASRKYGADMAARLLERLLSSEYGDRIEALIIGDGKHFGEFEERFAGHSRIRIERRFASQNEIAARHKEHGMFLVPTRLDSQGVSRDEAMSSGLVPITNAVTAVPEFVDDSCAVLAGDDDVETMARRTLEVMASPDLFRTMSENAAKRVRRQTAPDATVVREQHLLGLVPGGAG